MKRSSCLLVLTLFIVPGVLAQSNPKPLTLFSVNKKSVSTDEFIYLFEKNHKGKPEEHTQEKIEEYLNLYIKFKLKVEEARQRGMDTTAKFKKEFAGYKEALRKPYLPDAKLVDSLTQLSYKHLQEEVSAAHILIKLPPEALPADTLAAYTKIMDIKKRLDAGENFGTLAVTLSEDPSAKSNEGSLGYFTAFQMVYPFEAGAYSTSVGQVSNPIRTRFGYHLIKVIDRRKAMGEVEVSHLLVRTGKDRDSEKAKKQIFEIYDRLHGGMPWSDLCRQYSEDLSSKENGGKLRPFGVGAMASVPEFERTAFALTTPGEYSAPFATQYGWHIVRLEKKIPVPSYQEIEASLKSRVSRDERMQTAKAAIQKSLRKQYAFVENQNIKTQVLTLGDSSLQQGKWKTPVGSLGSEVLFSLAGKSVLVADFFSYVLAHQKANKQAPSAYLSSFYENFVTAHLEQEVEEKLLQTNADYRYLSNEYYEGILLFDIMEKEVWNRASEDSLGQRAFYEANKHDYTADERAEATLYKASKINALDTIQWLLEQDSMVSDELIKKNAIRIEKGKFEKSERPVFNTLNWSAGLQRAELDGNYYLVKIERILPAGERTFEETKGLLISDYQTSLENEWLKVLEKKYSVKINSKGKKHVLGKLITTE